MLKQLGLLFLSLSICLFAKAQLPNHHLLERSYPITGQAVPSKKDFERKFSALVRKWDIPAAQVAIIQNGRLTYARAFGYANLSSHQRAFPDSIFRVASVSKTITAATVLKLAEAGKVDLNTPVFKILNDIPPLPGDRINPRVYRITVKDLLQMASGWTSGAAADIMFGPWSQRTKEKLASVPASCYQTTRLMLSRAPRYRPGSHYDYSNLDYCILGLVIDKVTGHPYGYHGYEAYVRSAVLKPILINDMYIGSTLQSQRLPNEVKYYSDEAVLSPEEIINSFYLPYSQHQILQKNFANAGWVASAVDLARFAQALFSGQILDRKMLNLMIAKPSFRSKKSKSYYAMGVIVKKIKTGSYYMLTGSFTGSNAMVVRRPDGTIIAAVFNSRPAPYLFWVQFRPQLRSILIGSKV